jgi:hypothetical protein
MNEKREIEWVKVNYGNSQCRKNTSETFQIPHLLNLILIKSFKFKRLESDI